MADNPLEPGPQDHDRVNVLVESELTYWARAFGVPRQRLSEAIAQVGPAITDLKRELGEPRRAAAPPGADR